MIERKNRLIYLKKLLPLLGIAICMIGISLIFHLLREHSIHDVFQYLASIPTHLRWSAALLTLFSYLVLSTYDLLAFQFLGREISRSKIIIVSMIAFAFGNNIGMANLAGGSIRFRLYSALGIPAGKILKVILFSSLTFWLGVSALGGILFTFLPLRLPESFHIRPDQVRMLGIFLLFLGLFYLTLTTFITRPFYMRGYRLHLPPSRIGIQQMTVAAFDWFLAAYVLYLLMPGSIEVGFSFFLTVFVSAQMLALLISVPGGIGLLEASMIYFIAPSPQARPEILGALLAYRMIYYFAPLLVATIGLIGFEIRRKRRNTNEAS